MLTQISRQARVEPGDLVDLLLECHARIRHFVTLAQVAATRTDAPAEQIAEACASVLRYFTQALPLHVADEEESIVPRLKGQSAELDRALARMERQHREHEPKLSATLRAAEAVQHGPHDAASRHELANRAKLLEQDFDEHLALEESVIFPAIRGLLSPEQQASILEELRGRRRQNASSMAGASGSEH